MKLKHKVKRHICVILTLVAANSFAVQDIILADDGKAGDSFDYSVAIDGNTALIGAFKADIDNVIDAGAAYIYVLGENGWHKQAKLVAEQVFTNDTLGGKVALKNNVAMLYPLSFKMQVSVGTKNNLGKTLSLCHGCSMIKLNNAA